MKINNGTKRTYTAAKKTLQQMGIDIPKLKLRIEQTIARFLLAICPYLVHSSPSVAKLNSGRLPRQVPVSQVLSRDRFRYPR